MSPLSLPLPSARMRRIPILLLVALAISPAAAQAAADDPWVAYVANRVVTKQGRQAAVILRADPASGALVVVSGNGAQGSLFVRPYDLAASPRGDALYVADMGEFEAADGRVIRVDPATGMQSLVASGGRLVDPSGIAVAPDGTLYVLENVGASGDPEVLRVNPSTGAQAVVTSGDELCYPFGIAIEPAGSLVVTDSGSVSGGVDCENDAGAVVRVNAATGGQTIVSKRAEPWGLLIDKPFGVAVGPDRRDPDRERGRDSRRRDRGQSADRPPVRGVAELRGRRLQRSAAPGPAARRQRGGHRLPARRPGGRARPRRSPERRADRPPPEPPALQQPARARGDREPSAHGGAQLRAREGEGRSAGELRRLRLPRPRGPRPALRVGPRRRRRLRERRRSAAGVARVQLEHDRDAARARDRPARSAADGERRHARGRCDPSGSQRVRCLLAQARRAPDPLRLPALGAGPREADDLPCAARPPRSRALRQAAARPPAPLHALAARDGDLEEGAGAAPGRSGSGGAGSAGACSPPAATGRGPRRPTRSATCRACARSGSLLRASSGEPRGHPAAAGRHARDRRRQRGSSAAAPSTRARPGSTAAPRRRASPSSASASPG